MIVGRIVYAGSKLALSNQWKNTLYGSCRAWKAKSMWTNIVICRWIGSWSARAPFSAPGSSASKGWSPGALRHYQQLL